MTLSLDDSNTGEASALNETLFRLLVAIGLVALSSFTLSAGGQVSREGERRVADHPVSQVMPFVGTSRTSSTRRSGTVRSMT
jgi:hypothetical protein